MDFKLGFFLMICREETKPFILIKTQNKERYVLSVKRKASGFGASADAESLHSCERPRTECP